MLNHIGNKDQRDRGIKLTHTARRLDSIHMLHLNIQQKQVQPGRIIREQFGAIAEFKNFKPDAVFVLILLQKLRRFCRS